MVNEKSGIRRSKLEVYYYILKLCTNTKGETRSSLYKRITISYNQINEYAKDLDELGMLETSADGKVLKTTAKGKHFVKKFEYLIKQIR